mmetsp:Transcript_524/g.716  ORF Transcript_524/g.716 Transcript_524/m.716 type:complete len:153 (-) Transcript_524:133-591(-)
MSEIVDSKSTLEGTPPTTGEGSIGRCHACGCVGPNPGYDAMTAAEVEEEMKTLKPGYWTMGDDKKSISRSFICRNFKAAISYINAAADIAEDPAVSHHPDIHLTQYRNIEVRLFTHAVSGLTRYDFTLARALDSISVDYSPKWLKSHPEITQ